MVDTQGFSKVAEQVVYSGRIVDVAVAEFTTPEGETISREIARQLPSVGVVPLDGDEVILVRQFRAPVGRPLLEIPAGRCDVEGEPPDATARRELEEEIGQRAGELELLCGMVNSPGLMDSTTWCYLATGLVAVDRNADGPEERHMAIERYQLDDVPGLIADGEIEDAKTLVGLLMTRERLARR